MLKSWESSKLKIQKKKKEKIILIKCFEKISKIDQKFA